MRSPWHMIKWVRRRAIQTVVHSYVTQTMRTPSGTCPQWWVKFWFSSGTCSMGKVGSSFLYLWPSHVFRVCSCVFFPLFWLRCFRLPFPQRTQEANQLISRLPGFSKTQQQDVGQCLGYSWLFPKHANAPSVSINFMSTPQGSPSHLAMAETRTEELRKRCLPNSTCVLLTALKKTSEMLRAIVEQGHILT